MLAPTPVSMGPPAPGGRLRLLTVVPAPLRILSDTAFRSFDNVNLCAHYCKNVRRGVVAPLATCAICARRQCGRIVCPCFASKLPTMHTHPLSLWLQCTIVAVLSVLWQCASDRTYTTSVSSVQGKRSHMEDEVFVSAAGTFACVFDGHGGGFVSRYLRRNFYSTFLQTLPADEWPWHTELVAEAFRSALSRCDADIAQIKRWRHQGSTVSAVCLHGSHGSDADKRDATHVSCLNLGDSRAVLGRRGGAALDLSRDHKPELPGERARIEQLGGFVKWHGLVGPSGMPIVGTGCYRINGNLALSRAAGDHAERPFVSCTPDIRRVRLGEEDEFIILASDGLWDVFASDDACAFVCDCAAVLAAPSSLVGGGGLVGVPGTPPRPPPRSKEARLELLRAVNSFKAKMSATGVAAGGAAGVEAGAGLPRGPVRTAAFRRLVAPLLVEAALRRGSSDNISCVVLWLREADEG